MTTSPKPTRPAKKRDLSLTILKLLSDADPADRDDAIRVVLARYPQGRGES